LTGANGIQKSPDKLLRDIFLILQTKMVVYFYPLHFIRFLLALGVLLFHYGTSYYPFSSGVLKTLIDHSAFRVSFFFFISGFILTLVYQQKEDTRSPLFFYKKRLTRILPVYWLAFVVTLLLVIFVKGAGPKGLVILLHALGLQTWNPGYVLDLNFTTWSISVELFFYALFPFLLTAMKRWSPARLLIIGSVIYLLQSLQHYFFVELLSDGTKRVEEFISTFPLWHLGTFISGMVTARCIAQELVPDWFKKRTVVVFFLSLCVLLVLLYIPNPVLKYIHNGLLSPLFMLLVLSLYFDTTWLGRSLSRPLLTRLGDLSYGIFIFQYPLWLIFTAVFSAEQQRSSFYFLFYVLSVMAVSYLVNRFFEKPVLLKLRTKYKIA
jgi:peptidoglycan/LPS O-acetylase OafA/YrhL